MGLPCHQRCHVKDYLLCAEDPVQSHQQGNQAPIYGQCHAAAAAARSHADGKHIHQYDANDARLWAAAAADSRSATSNPPDDEGCTSWWCSQQLKIQGTREFNFVRSERRRPSSCLAWFGRPSSCLGECRPSSCLAWFGPSPCLGECRPSSCLA